jgi:hypothetical protein
MTRTAHDEFAKDWLKSFLSDFGQVETEFQISSEARHVDVYFQPRMDISPPHSLGLVGKMIANPCLIEPFRNPIPEREICNCLGKSAALGDQMLAESKRQRRDCQHLPLTKRFRFRQRPFLWMITPTLSDNLQQDFILSQRRDWGEGIYFTGKAQRGAIIAVHSLPAILDTLWLRLLGRDRVQKQAIRELMALPLDHPYRELTLRHVAILQQNLKARQNISKDLRKVIMTLSITYEQIESEILQRGLEQGLERGLEQGLEQGQTNAQRAIVLNMRESGLGIDQIAQLTGLSLEVVQVLSLEKPSLETTKYQ